MTDDEFEEFISSLQGKAFAEALNAYGEKGFERWRNPRFHGRMANADGYGRITGVCGDTIEMFIQVEQGKVADASYSTTGCGSSAICSSFTAEFAIGKELEEVFELQGEEILDHIGTFPENETHCAFLAVNTLQEAVSSYLVKSVKKEKEGN